MTKAQAIVKAAAVLGKAKEHLLGNGWRGVADECQEAINDLQDSVDPEYLEVTAGVAGRVELYRLGKS